MLSTKEFFSLEECSMMNHTIFSVLHSCQEYLERSRLRPDTFCVPQVYINMQQPDRYTSKLDELKTALMDRLKKKTDGEGTEEFPPCFISYCWKNSARAVSKGSRTVEGAAGFGDPRDIKDHLEAKGIHCWIDIERVGVVRQLCLFSLSSFSVCLDCFSFVLYIRVTGSHYDQCLIKTALFTSTLLLHIMTSSLEIQQSVNCFLLAS